MATKARKKATNTNTPTFGQLEKQVGRLRKDIERTVDRVGREAGRYIPKSSQRQFNDLVGKVGDLSGTVTKRVTKAVNTVRADVEDTVEDLRGTTVNRVNALRKDVTDSGQRALENVEKEIRKQFEGLLKALGVPMRSDLDGVKRRVGALERKIEALVEGTIREQKARESQAS